MPKCIARSEGDRLAVTVEINLSQTASDEIAAMTLNFSSSLAKFSGNVSDLLIRGARSGMSGEEFQEKYMQLGIVLFKDIIAEKGTAK